MMKKLMIGGMLGLLTMSSLVAGPTDAEKATANRVFRTTGGVYFRTQVAFNVGNEYIARDTKNSPVARIEDGGKVTFVMKEAPVIPVEGEHNGYQYIGTVNANNTFKAKINGKDVTLPLDLTQSKDHEETIDGVPYVIRMSISKVRDTWMNYPDGNKLEGLAYLVGIDYVKTAEDVAKEKKVKAENKEALILNEIKDQKTIAENALKDAKLFQEKAEKTKNLKDALEAKNKVGKLLKAAQEAVNKATTKAAKISIKVADKETALNAAKEALKEIQEHEVKIKAAYYNLKDKEQEAEDANKDIEKITPILAEIKNQQQIAKDQLAKAKAAQIIAETTVNLEKAENAKKEVKEAVRIAKDAETKAATKALEISYNKEAQDAAKDTQESVNKIKECLVKSTAAIKKMKSDHENAAKLDLKVEGEKLFEIKKLEDDAKEELKKAEAARKIAESTANLNDALNAETTITEALKVVEKAFEKANTLLKEIAYNKEAQKADVAIEVAREKIKKCAEAVKAVCEKLKTAEEAKMPGEVNEQHTIVVTKEKEAEAEFNAVKGAKDFHMAQQALKKLEKAYDEAKDAEAIATAKAAKIPANQEAQKKALESKQSVERIQEWVKTAKTSLEKLKTAEIEKVKEKIKKKLKKGKKDKKSKKSKKSKSKKSKSKKDKKPKKFKDKIKNFFN